MTTRYCGPGGSDASDGLSYANRKLTLNGVEDTPVAAGDICYVAPGVYRETWTVDVSGSSGSPITYIGDVTGEHTDGIGGIVRITGSDDDLSATRANGITATTKSYRTFQGFYVDTCTGVGALLSTGCTYCVVQDCYFSPTLATACLTISGAAQAGNLVQRCVFHPFGNQPGIQFSHTSVADNTAQSVLNCVFLGGVQEIVIARVGGITVKNCSFLGRGIGVQVGTALTAGQTTTVNNCIFQGCLTAVSATAVGEITENYNTFFGNNTDRTNTNTGANSVTYPALLMPPPMLAGFQYPWTHGQLSPWSQVRAKAGTGMAADDLFGITRPATDSKKSWGAVQFHDTYRDTGTKYEGTAALRFDDAGKKQIFVPTGASSTTFSVNVIRATSYAGSNPELSVFQPGTSACFVQDTGAASTWNTLSVDWTPNGSPSYTIVQLSSHNTAASSGSVVGVWFDNLVVS